MFDAPARHHSVRYHQPQQQPRAIRVTSSESSSGSGSSILTELSYARSYDSTASETSPGGEGSYSPQFALPSTANTSPAAVPRPSPAAAALPVIASPPPSTVPTAAAPSAGKGGGAAAALAAVTAALPRFQKQRQSCAVQVNYDEEVGASGDEDMQGLVEKFSALEQDIKSLIKGKNSLKDRIQLLGSRQESTKGVLDNLKESQQGMRGRLDALEQQAKQRIDFLTKLNDERQFSLAQLSGNSTTVPQKPMSVLESIMEQSQLEEVRVKTAVEEYLQKQKQQQLQQPQQQQQHQQQQPQQQPQHQQQAQSVQTSSTSIDDKFQPDKLTRIIRCWDENNCDLHIRRLIYSSRQIAAYEILEFAHKRLSFHLINFISESARGYMGDAKAGYLASFIKNGPFQSKPVGEGTYADLLKFVQREQHKSKRELLRALKAAEDKLIEEAVNAGYSAYEIGDIRPQMTGFFVATTENCSRYCYPIPLADTEVTKEIIDDTLKAANEGKLGVLQKAAKLIKLGCYFLRRQL